MTRGGNDRNGWQANLPPRWLNDSTYKSLSVNAWTLHTWTLVWGVSQENDGYLTARDLPFIAAPMLNRIESEGAAQELVREGLWEITVEGYHVVEWERSQVTADEIAEKRSTWRAKNNRRKSSTPSEAPVENPSFTPGVDAADSASNGTLQVGQEGKEVQERQEQPRSTEAWSSASPGKPGELNDPYCSKHGTPWPCDDMTPECEWSYPA